FDVWTYQIMDIDLDAGTMDVECYSIGNQEYVLENVLIDQFHRYFGKQKPAQPQLLPLADSLVTLPHTFEGSVYFSPEGELYNATEFELAGATGDFENDLILTVKRDFEDYFQIENAAYWSPINQQEGVDIFKFSVDSTQVFQGKNWLRVRYRDRNLEWSDWSEPLAFYALNGNVPLSLEPIAWWRFNGDAYDETGHGNDGVVPATGVTFVQDTPIRGQVAQFNNTQSIVVRSGPAASQGLPVTQMTVSGWVKVAAADTWGGFIGCLQDNGSYERGWVLGTRAQKFSFALVSENTSAMTYLEDTQNFNLNQWYYLTATYNGASMKLFVDGVLKSVSTAQSGDITYAGLVSDWFGIGAYVDENENWLHHGELDELILWERALSDGEVAQLYMEQSNFAPQVTLVEPVNNAIYLAPASIVVEAEAADQDGTVGLVEFYNGTQKLFEDTDGAPFTFIWDNAPEGIHTLTAKATDNLGSKTTSAPVEVVVLVNMQPDVSILSPENNATFIAPANIELMATATDSDGSIARVEFLANALEIGEDNDGAPYAFNWANVPAGTYQLTARAVDNHGATRTSEPVSIVVTMPVSATVAPGTQSIQIAPNPGSGAFRFLTDENLGGALLRVYNAEKQLVSTQRLTGREIDLSELQAGAYFLEIHAEGRLRWQTTLVKI
ncbi:MAG: T9SS type A sorting domain-containing protein, partial [Saprospiraceae bacterium]|nr:T9SS type A sorting domain-containing protein [Saprospiraceae bacterium]